MSLRSGTRLAITGPSGSGKSSVVAALMRTLDPAAGAVLADGRDVRDLASDTVRDGIAWCGAAAHLFENTAPTLTPRRPRRRAHRRHESQRGLAAWYTVGGGSGDRCCSAWCSQ